MIVRDVHIDGFGVWYELTLPDLSPQCTVFYGPNEAGKSTLLEFLRSSLFGFAADRSSQYLPPVHGDEPGGHITFQSTKSQAGRLLRRPDAYNRAGMLSLTIENEHLHAESALANLLCDVDEATFSNVFAIGLRELQELGSLDDASASRWLYSLTTGLDRVSLNEVTRELETSRSRIYSSEGVSQVSMLLDERDRLRRELEDLADLPKQYETLLAHRDGIQREIDTARLSSTQTQAELPNLDLAIALHDRWHLSRALSSQVDSLEAGNTWPANALQKMDQLRSRYSRARAELRKLKAERAQKAAELAQLRFDERLWRQSAHIAALAEHEAWILGVEQEFEGAEANAKSAGDQYSAQKNQLAGRRALPASETIDANAWAILRNPAARMSKARRRLKKTRAECDAHRTAAQNRKQELDKSLSGRGHRDLSAAVESCGVRVQQLRRRGQLEKQLENTQEVVADLEGQIAVLLERQVLSPFTTFVIGTAFVVGVVFTLAGLLLPASFTGGWGWPMFFFGGLGAVLAVASKYSMEHTMAMELDAARTQLAMAEKQSAEAQNELEELEQILPKGGGPLNQRLQIAEQELAKLEQLMPLEAQRQAAEGESQTREAKLAEAERIYKKYRHRWKTALASVGLPTDTSPLQAQEISMTGGRLSAANSRLADANSEVERRRRELNALSARIQQVFLAIGTKPKSSRTSEQLRQLTEELAKHETLQQQRKSIGLQLRRFKKKRVAIVDHMQRLQRRRDYLLKKCQVIDVADFNRRAANSTKLKTLIAERDALLREIDTAWNGLAVKESVEAYLASQTLQQLSDLVANKRQQIVDWDAKRTVHETQREQVSKQLDRLSADRRPATKRFQLGLIEEQLSAALRRWQTLTVTQRVLAAVKADYERNRQPEALRAASGYLVQFTRGRYKRVWTTFGEETLLVEDAHGKSLPVEKLSRGTREQLFLSLRMAIVGMFGHRGARLPMILDDVLVNFDNDRAEAGVQVLQNFSMQDHQLIVFTCHEHIARMFKLAGADVRRLPESGRPGRDLPFEFEEPRVVEVVAEEPPPVVVMSVTTTQPEFVVVPATIEITAQAINTAAEVEVHVVESPVLTLPEPLPPPPVVVPVAPARRARIRVDAPQRKRQVVIPAIRRRWAAEEFSGELDDRINPQWLLHELSPELTPAVENGNGSMNSIDLPPSYAKLSGMRMLKLFDAEPAPVVVETVDASSDGEY